MNSIVLLGYRWNKLEKFFAYLNFQMFQRRRVISWKVKEKTIIHDF